MNRYACKNCKLEFEADDPSQCPRCSSVKILKSQPGASEEVVKKEPKRFVFGVPVTDTKESWMKFHNTGEAQQCPGCGASDFNLDWKKREKVCIKCGEILPLRRR